MITNAVEQVHIVRILNLKYYLRFPTNVYISCQKHKQTSQKLKSLKKYIKDFLFYEFSDITGVKKKLYDLFRGSL